MLAIRCEFILPDDAGDIMAMPCLRARPRRYAVTMRRDAATRCASAPAICRFFETPDADAAAAVLPIFTPPCLPRDGFRLMPFYCRARCHYFHAVFRRADARRYAPPPAIARYAPMLTVLLRAEVSSAAKVREAGEEEAKEAGVCKRAFRRGWLAAAFTSSPLLTSFDAMIDAIFSTRADARRALMLRRCAMMRWR